MRIVYLFVLILFTISNIYGQSAVKLSSEKVKIGGNVYYVHTVQKKETLYSLSKAYNVQQEEIIEHNQSAVSGLKMGTILYIPVKSSSTATNAPAKGDQPTDKKDKRQADKKIRKHTVKWYEDITDISEKYSVSVEAIMAFNNLKSSKLKPRQILLIPESMPSDATPAEIATSSDNLFSTVVNDTLSRRPDDNIVPALEIVPGNVTNSDANSKLKYRNNGEQVEFAYILPLNSIDTNNINTNFMDFYAGSMLAANDMKSDGFPVKINVYDQSEYTPLHKLIDAPGFSNNQLLIGPARAKIIKEFTGYSQNAEIPLVSPLDNSAETFADTNPYFIQMPANTLSQMENTIELLDNYRIKDSVSTILLVYEKGNVSDSIYVDNAKKLLQERGIEYTPISYGILDGREIYTTILASVDTLSTKPHIALVPSNSEAFVSDVVRNLDLCRKPGAIITLFGFPKWRNFETINVEMFHNMNLHISLPYFVDYTNEDVKRFLLQYRALYNTEPTPYAFQGYDITKYLLEQMEKYGNSFIHQDNPAAASMLQSDFRLRKDDCNERSGLKNRATRNIRYNPDFTISVVK